MLRSVRRVALAAVVASLAAGCGASPEGSAAEPTTGEGAERRASAVAPEGVPSALAAQRLQWTDCAGTEDSPAPGDDWRCATLEVPVDWSAPEDDTMKLALIRSEARGDRRIGSLLFNFGGPGASGVATMPSYGGTLSSLHERYDLVSWDPRGVGASSGIRCRDDAEIAEAESVDMVPETAAEEAAFLEDAADFGQGCEDSAGPLLAHVSTADTARDMELMRHVLGDRDLNYFGFSYGTELGGVYAHLFPERVGRMVLDAVVDPTADVFEHAENQARGFQRALDAYLESTGQDPREGTRRLADLLERIDQDPLPTASEDRRLTRTLAVIGIVLPLYSESAWPTLTDALRAAREGDGTELLALADAYHGRDASGHYATTTHSQRAISCLDARQRPTVEETRERLPRFEEISPVFGPLLGWDTAGWCHDWPVAGLNETPEVSAPGADPVLVVGNTGDPATPYEGARRMADELGEDVGVMITWEGQGHGAYGNGSDCVETAVDTYLLEGKAPEDGMVCSR
ncbi:alpha/beta hydrolase [Streptomyces sp. WMMC905]|uniref:alpha/beta hydrolase n=1 Tax=Streptomyces sp. WMMC905 TaxID=3404123 RepID=UPI003B94F3FB